MQHELVAPPTAAELECGVWVRANICGGSPCVAGQRLPVRSIMSFHDEGFTPAEIVEQYPTATVEQVNAVIRWSAEQHQARAEAKAQRVAEETENGFAPPALNDEEYGYGSDPVKMAQLLAERDDFIVEIGMFAVFCEWLSKRHPAAPAEDLPTLPMSALRGHG